jgi:multicomponent Na+:H+ antiporter subunit A
MMGLLLVLHALVGGLAILFGERLGRHALRLVVVAPVATLCWLLTQADVVLGGGAIVQRLRWVPALDLTMDLRLDGFGFLMVLLVSGIGVAVMVYAQGYFPLSQEGLGRLIGLLALFSGAMLGLVLADNLLMLYLCWELTSVTSYLLIGNRHESSRARAAALQALLITGAGGLVMLVGFILLGQAAGTYELTAILTDPPSGTIVGVALALILVGAVTKSAQYPFHSWLPGAMVAPTPVSAYLHSATMVKAGVYLVARFTPAFVSVPFWRPTVVTIGLIGMFAGGVRALRQHDLKLLLAFGTISQLGFMFVMFGIGTPAADAAGCALLLAHGVFKATLFMSVGVLDHQLGTRDVRELPRLGREWRSFSVVTVLSAASMAGIPLTFGFIAKEEDYDAVASSGLELSTVVTVGIVAASMLTFAYSARFLIGALRGNGSPAPAGRAPRLGFLLPGMVLASVTLVLGVLPRFADELISSATNALAGTALTVHLALWHGVNLALVLSGITIAGGLVVVAASYRGLLAPLFRVGAKLPTGSALYLASLRGMNAAADKVTGIVQNGSLPVYAGVTLLTVFGVPGLVLLAGPLSEVWRDVSGFRGESTTLVAATVFALVVMVGAGIGAGVTRRRFTAALLLAGTGYGMAALFVIMGAPDLALTQVAVETLFTVLFVLVLRRLPDRFERRSTAVGRGFRVVVSAGVGVVVFVFALVASGVRLPRTVSDELVARSLPDGHGRNVVNVILVDFRAFDTLGEITVLVAAAIGAVALTRALVHPGDRRRSPDGEIDSVPDGGAGAASTEPEVAP